ncbi:MAG: O-antigen ligase family protein [Desulfovibrionaceae bacterium]|nr:O-antigen ligase family protein [Desulfovibrionaceae bacterium]MBF0514282.1 O-antigen ligase family protein [Desulfovibrionaceae bacterium]
METSLGLALLGLVGLTGLLIARFCWTRSRGRTQDFPPFFFGLWLVSTVVWNTYFASFHIPGLFDVSIERILFFGMICSCFMRRDRNRIELRTGHSIEIWILIFLLICILSMSLNGFDAINPVYPKPWFLFFASYVVPFVAFLYAKYYLHDERSIRFVMKTFFALGVYLCLTAFFERARLNFLVFPAYILNPNIPLHLDRARGPFLNAAFNGLGMTIGFAAGIYLLSRSRGGSRLFMLLLLGLFFPGIFLTYTRSSYLGFLLVLAMLLFAYRTRVSKWKLTPIILSLAAIFMVANSGKLFSSERSAGGIGQLKEVEIRFQLINRSIHLFETHPFLGVGLAHFSVAESSPDVSQDPQHNHLIGLGVELGILGLSCYLVILILIFKRLYALAEDPRNDTVERANQIILLCTAFSINLLTNVFIEPSYCMFINVNTFVFAGIIDRFYSQPDLLDGPSA